MGQPMPLLSDFHPLISTWFQEKFQGATEPQLRGWPDRTGRTDLRPHRIGEDPRRLPEQRCPLRQVSRQGYRQDAPAVLH